MSSGIKQILIYTRNTEVHFHLELAKQLQQIYPNIRIIFITFFSWSEKVIKSFNYEVRYMPIELERVTGDEISDERYIFDLRRFINNEIYNLNIKNIENIAMNTFLKKEFFFSHRRSCLNKEQDYGRCISVILMT